MLSRLWFWLVPPFGPFRYYTYRVVGDPRVWIYWYWRGRRSRDFALPNIARAL